MACDRMPSFLRDYIAPLRKSVELFRRLAYERASKTLAGAVVLVEGL